MCRVQPPDMPHLAATGLRDQPTCLPPIPSFKLGFFLSLKLGTLEETTTWRCVEDDFSDRKSYRFSDSRVLFVT